MNRSNVQIYLAVIGLLLILVVGLVIWTMTEKRRPAQVLQNERASQVQQIQSQQETLEKQWQQRLSAQEATQLHMLDTHAGNLLRVAAVPLGWLVRAEMGPKNMGRVRSYFDELVSSPGIRNIELADSTGTVLVATDKGRESAPLEANYPAAVLEVDKPTVFQFSAGQFVVAVPIFGLSAKQGTVTLSYNRNATRVPPAAAMPAAMLVVAQTALLKIKNKRAPLP